MNNIIILGHKPDITENEMTNLIQATRTPTCRIILQ